MLLYSTNLVYNTVPQKRKPKGSELQAKHPDMYMRLYLVSEKGL